MSNKRTDCCCSDCKHKGESLGYNDLWECKRTKKFAFYCIPSPDCFEAKDLDITPMITPKFNISDIILVKNALEVTKDNLIPELQDRVELIIQELLRAEKESKNVY